MAQNSKLKLQTLLLPWLDAIAIGAWGLLLLYYWFNGKLNLLIHPDYFWLAIAGGIGLLIIGGLRMWMLWETRRPRPWSSRLPVAQTSQHLTLFPPGWGSTLLLVTAILGFLITPRVFTSETALQRGVTDALTMTRSQPQSFRSAKRPEERSLLEWVRTLTVYPEPDAYNGQKVKVQGFVVHPQELPAQYFLLSRFIITCCAADAYPVGLPVKLTGGQDGRIPTDRTAYKPDTWLEVEGQMTTETLAEKRQLTIVPSSIKPIPEPKNPYEY